MAEKKGAAPAPPEVPEPEQVPTVVAGPPLPDPVREHIWDEDELRNGALREHWTDDLRVKGQEVTDNA